MNEPCEVRIGERPVLNHSRSFECHNPVRVGVLLVNTRFARPRAG